jgi:mannitol-1-phosphate 5-dehydrogenase
MRVLIFGAGGVGLGFMGDLLGRVSAEIIFADVNTVLVDSLARHGQYTFSKADLEKISPVTVRGVRAVDTGRPEGRAQLAEELAAADFCITSVGARVLPLVGKGLAEALREGPERAPLNFLCCENHRDAAGLLREAVAGVLGPAEAEARCGFVNTVVGRMCQNLTRLDRDLPPLTPDLEAVILVEDYDPFPIDAGAWRGPLAPMPCLEPVPTEQFVAYEHRKLYGHNGVHALLGVLGKARGYQFFYEAGQDAELDALARRAMWEEIGAALVRAHPRYFTEASIDAFATNLYARLVNPVFADEIERGAKDTLRMIRPEDGRLAVAALFVAAQGLEPRAMCAGVAAALRDNGLGIEGLAEVLAEAEPGAAEVVKSLVVRELTILI